MLGDDVVYHDVALGDGRREHICARLDLVGYHAVIGAVKAADAADLDDVGAGAADIGAHAVEKVGYVDHVGFFGRVLDDGVAGGQDSRQQDVDRGADGDHVEIDVAAVEVLAVDDDDAVLDRRGGSEGPEALEMLVDGARADVAAAGKGDLGVVVFAKERAQQVVTRADMADVLVIDAGLADVGAVDPVAVAIFAFDADADLFHGVAESMDIADVRDVVDSDSLVGHDGRREYAKGGVFGAAYIYVSDKRVSTLHVILHA